MRALLDEAQDPIVARTLLERVIDGNDLVGINYLSIGSRRARSVCRIHLRDEAGRSLGFGTGFLVAPGVLLTNHHVIANADDARHAVAEFDYEFDEFGVDKPVIRFRFSATPAPITYEPLDFCLVGVEQRSIDGRHQLKDLEWIPLNGAPGKAIVGEYLTIVQHPGGERKQVCVRENKLLRFDENQTTLWYSTDTVGGSSGSPVFNGSWQVVALHHSGIPKTDAKGRWLTIDGKVWDRSMDESRVQWVANEGIRVSAIFAYLRQNHAAHPFARATLSSSAPKPDATLRNGHGSEHAHSEIVGDELRMVIPVRVAVRLDTNGFGGNGHAAPRSDSADISDAAPNSIPANDVQDIESVSVDQSNYGQRPGHQVSFLGGGKLRVPLPVLKRGARNAARLMGSKSTELKYWNYSVVMHKTRCIAVFTIANVDANLRPRQGSRDGDRWFFDTRLAETSQLGPEFYGRQKEFEIDRSSNPFDRGHLTRRLDAQWGKNAREQKRNGDDSFHWTNCAPQHWKFNQGKKRWLGLEDFVIDGFAGDSERRAVVINGPVFDAPRSKIAANGRPTPNLKGKHEPDPTFGEVAIPKLFFKIVACEREGKLAAAAFLLSQEDFLGEVDRLREETLTDAEARLFQVRVADIERLTGLDFGAVGSSDALASEAMVSAEPLAIDRLEHIRL